MSVEASEHFTAALLEDAVLMDKARLSEERPPPQTAAHVASLVDSVETTAQMSLARLAPRAVWSSLNPSHHQPLASVVSVATAVLQIPHAAVAASSLLGHPCPTSVGHRQQSLVHPCGTSA